LDKNWAAVCNEPLLNFCGYFSQNRGIPYAEPGKNDFQESETKTDNGREKPPHKSETVIT